MTGDTVPGDSQMADTDDTGGRVDGSGPAGGQDREAGRCHRRRVRHDLTAGAPSADGSHHREN
jgi:hypothetical protein